MIRFEILLPLYYNDGRSVEREKFIETDDEIVRIFGATSTDTVVVRGRWLYKARFTKINLFGCGLTWKTRRRIGARCAS